MVVDPLLLVVWLSGHLWQDFDLISDWYVPLQQAVQFSYPVSDEKPGGQGSEQKNDQEININQ